MLRPPDTTPSSNRITMELSSNALAKESIAYRFESQSTIDEAREEREQEWKAAYERYGPVTQII